MIKFGFFFFLAMNLFDLASADALMAEARATEKRATMYQVPLADYKNYARTLGENDKTFKKLIAVADILEVESISSYNREPSVLDLKSVTQAMVTKMNSHPKWDAPLSAAELKQLDPDLELIKNTFGEKTYGWAWFLKQNGKAAKAKKILTDLFEVGSKGVFQMTMIHFDRNPLSEMQFIQEALAPMCNEAERTQMEAKMQKMKNHVSNLPNSMMMT